jgi:hypothetical protein
MPIYCTVNTVCNSDITDDFAALNPWNGMSPINLTKKKQYRYTYNNFPSETTDPVIISCSIHVAVNNNRVTHRSVSGLNIWRVSGSNERKAPRCYNIRGSADGTCSNHCAYGFQFTAIRSAGNFFSISSFFRIFLHSLPFVVLSSSFLYSSLFIFVFPYLISFLFTSVSTITNITYSSCNQ